MPRKLTQEEFLAKANKIHNFKYNYDKAEYKGGNEFITITCPKHGDFQQKANTHLHGSGCVKCKNEKIKSLKNKGREKFIEDAIRVNGNKYIYDKVVYRTSKHNVIITCPIHGDFEQTPNSHLRGCGCPKCADGRTGDRCRMTVEEFLSRAKEVHANKYDYSLVTKETFIDSYTAIEIICKKHGVFKQSPGQHLGGRGCYWCGKESMAQKQALTRDDVVRRCNEIFDKKYDYSLFTEYHSKKDIIQVICPKHGVWSVSIDNHMYRQSGCPHCKRSLGEERIAQFLDSREVVYIPQYKFNNEYLLCSNKKLVVDFYLPSMNIVIEYNGIQHYEQSPVFKERTLEEQKERDFAIQSFCKQHNLKLIVISYKEYGNIDSILSKHLKVYKT